MNNPPPSNIAGGPPPLSSTLWGKLLIGCLVLAGLAVLVVIILFAAGSYWFLSPGKQQAVEKAVSPASQGVVHIVEPDQDPGIRVLVTRFVYAAQRAGQARDRKELPPSLRWVEGFQRQQAAQSSANAGAMLSWWLPREAVVSFEPIPGEGGTQTLFVANFRRMVRPVRMLLEAVARDDRKVKRRAHGGEELLVFPSGATVSFAGGTLLWASDPRVVEAALDRLAGPAREPPAGPILPPDPEGKWDAAGTATAPAAIGKVLAAVSLDRGEEDPLRRAKALTFGLDVATADEIAAELTFSFASAAAAEAAEEELRGRLEVLGIRNAARHLTFTYEAERSGEGLVATLRAGGIEEALERWVAGLEESGAAPPSAAPEDGEVPPEVEQQPAEEEGREP